MQDNEFKLESKLAFEYLRRDERPLSESEFYSKYLELKIIFEQEIKSRKKNTTFDVLY